MPSHALERVAVDHCVKASELPLLLGRLVREPAAEQDARTQILLETREEAGPGLERAVTGATIGVESGLTCPECSGILREVREGDVLRFRCRVGHAYTSQTMLEAQGEAVEKALWIAVRSLEERSMLLDKLAENARQRGHDGIAALFEDRSIALSRDVRFLRDLIARGRALEPVGHEGIA
jgi:two-component system chemotaxis response regulator CheB